MVISQPSPCQSPLRSWFGPGIGRWGQLGLKSCSCYPFIQAQGSPTPRGVIRRVFSEAGSSGSGPRGLQPEEKEQEGVGRWEVSSLLCSGSSGLPSCWVGHFESSVYILGTRSSSKMWFANIFSQSVSCFFFFFILLTMLLAEQTFLMLMEANSSIFSCMEHAFAVLFQNS